mmetsp:Transcript_16613/g.24834  ORF Transcript_16613/g.24834 Transcript_16613/m.24834 type:complete len:647 (+) Transcript_16613:231-2171(+)|eukprot:CAMPEP_0203674428 /NCGR_PEP_ID=MMETSP0090-20130426/16156_1 /ASSEMBLY_ACC=CAM_ASM_001088 /TAXON_ID=426623 /ORGANISM="Chaetoceros affinis, Strain CCMP159" /LENGTH=646 /DNA_ID=CAMNT_0050540299 /DNA_START=121 /DNA_END=2061 /DNA_ORIENTATION=+
MSEEHPNLVQEDEVSAPTTSTKSPAGEETLKSTMSKSAMSDDTDWDKVDDDIPQPSDDVLAAAVNATAIVKRSPKDEEPSALQIVSIGTETDQYAFTFHEDTLQSILKQIPVDKKVCVVSVVGAFRTGKSFLLSWFLRYLKHYEAAHQKSRDEEGSGITVTEEEGGTSSEKWFEEADTLGRNGFHWRGGAERNTTGIWMWSKPYILPRVNDTTGEKEDIAVLLVDTQGMFDHETTMALTAAIFGLSTLLSSYQIYNVDKRIQEDNLQQLALFSEYGRMAIQTEGKEKKEKTDNDEKTNVSDDSEEGDEKEETSTKEKEQSKPFQKIEFLVRDWQNFEDEDDLEACEREMEEYLENVLAEREAADLKDTREQITACFDNVCCYLMTHPGKEVTKKKYNGEIEPIDSAFKVFMDRYCSRVFEHLIPKSIHGRELTAMELGAYIRNYAKMFETGAHFPEAATMLEATSNANNTNALNLTVKKYKEEMDSIAGAAQTNYMNPVLLEEFHRTLISQSMRTFDDIACFGNKRAIEEARSEVTRSIEENFEVYTKLNESRNPLAGIETYIIPLTIGFLSIIIRWTADWTCTSWSQTCKAGSEFFSHVYQVVFFFLAIIASTKAKQLSDAAGRLKVAWEAMQGGNQVSVEKKTN